MSETIECALIKLSSNYEAIKAKRRAILAKKKEEKEMRQLETLKKKYLNNKYKANDSLPLPPPPPSK